MVKKPWFKIIAGIGVTVLALWLSFREIDWPAFLEAVRRIHWGWAVLAVANVILSVFVMGWRWKILLKPEASFSLGKLFRLNMVSQYWNIILPARGGDVVKTYLVNREGGVPAGFAAGTVVLEKIFDFFVFGGLVLAAPLLLGVDQSWWPGAKTALIAFAAFVALIAFAAFILRKPVLLIKWVEVFSRIFPQKFQKALKDFFLSGAYSFHILRQPRIIASLVLFSFFFVGVQALSNYFVFLAFGWRLSFWAALIVLLTLQVVSIPPSALGKIGIFEYMVILALSIYGVEKEEALGYAVLLHLVVYLPKIMMGFCFIARGRSTKRPPPAETGGLEIK